MSLSARELDKLNELHSQISSDDVDSLRAYAQEMLANPAALAAHPALRNGLTGRIMQRYRCIRTFLHAIRGAIGHVDNATLTALAICYVDGGDRYRSKPCNETTSAISA